MMTGHTHLILQLQIIHFYHHAINFIWKIITLLFKLVAVINYFLYAFAYLFFFLRATKAKFPHHS